MADYQRIALSGSTNYLPINVSGTTFGSAVTVHTAHATNADELWLYAYNYGNLDALLNISLGGNAAHQIITTPVPSKLGEIPVLIGKTYTNSVVIKAYANIADSLSIIGYVNRIVFT